MALSKLPVIFVDKTQSLADQLVSCVVHKEKLRRENNALAAQVKAETLAMVDFRVYQDEEFDVIDDAIIDVRTKIELEIMYVSLGLE